MAIIFSLYFLLCNFSLVLMDSLDQPQPPSLPVKFWLSVELQTITWKLGCLNTGGCAEPRLRLLKSNMVNGEKLSIDWPVTGDVVKDKARPFVTHWSIESSDDVMLTCEVIGVDPMYGFPRVCDSSAAVRVYSTGPSGTIAPVNTATKVRRDAIKDPMQMLIKLDGKCFNATMIGRKFAERCPWCKEEPVDVTISANNPIDSALHDSLRQSHNEQFLQMSVIVLAIITVVTSAGCALLLVACLRQKSRNSRQLKQKFPNQRTFEYHEQAREIGPPIPAPRAIPDASSFPYEVPWDTKFRPLPSFPPSEYIEADMDSLPGRRLSGSPAGQLAPYGRSVRISPNSSSIHDDSGLDSV